MTSEVIEDEKQFYSKAKTYWKEVPPTVDGMLGGYGHISAIDISSSRKFLQRFLRVGRSGVLSRRRGCGAGATSSVSRCRVFGHLPVAATQAWKDGGGVGGCGLWTLPRQALGDSRVPELSRLPLNCPVLPGMKPLLSGHVRGHWAVLLQAGSGIPAPSETLPFQAGICVAGAARGLPPSSLPSQAPQAACPAPLCPVSLLHPLSIFPDLLKPHVR